MGRLSKEYAAFRNLTDRLLAVSRETIQERQARYLEESAKNPNRPGPKPKQKRKAMRPSVSHDSGD